MGACRPLAQGLWLWGWHPEPPRPHVSQRLVSGAGIGDTLPAREAGPASQGNIRHFLDQESPVGEAGRARAGGPSRVGPAGPSWVLSGLQPELPGLPYCPGVSPMFWLIWLKAWSIWNVPERELSLRPGGPTSGKPTFSANKSTASEGCVFEIIRSSIV